MAIDKFNYIKPGKFAKIIALKTLTYIAKDKEETPRILFGHDGPLTREQAVEIINNAPKNTYYWRFMLSPDIKTENIGKNLDFWKLTKDVVEFLEVRLKRPNIPFIAAEHNNTKNPHTHAMLLMQRRGRELIITREILEEVYQEATAAAHGQRKKLDRFQKHLSKRQSQAPVLQNDHAQIFAGSTRRAYLKLACPQCGSGQVTRIPSKNILSCSLCGYGEEIGISVEGAECSL
jgi:hypothetical protein